MDKVKRPLGVNLIIIYIIIQIILTAFYTVSSGYGSPIGIFTFLWIFAIYGLWKMQKEWMHVVIFLLGLSTVVEIILMASNIFNYFGMIDVILNIIVMYWLGDHRSIFIAPEKSKSGWTLGKVLTIVLVVFFVLIMVGVLAYYGIFAPSGFLNNSTPSYVPLGNQSPYVQTVEPVEPLKVSLIKTSLIKNETNSLKGSDQYIPFDLNLTENEEIEIIINVTEGGNLNTLLTNYSEYKKLTSATSMYIMYYPSGLYSGVKSVDIIFIAPQNDHYILLVGNAQFLAEQVKQEGSVTFNTLIYGVERE